MREIEFRAIAIEDYHTHHETIEEGEFVYGRLGYNNIMYVKMSQESGGVGSGIVIAEIKIDPKTIGQFTGIIDKNKKKIYEDDIVKYFHSGLNRFVNATIEWSDIQAMFRVVTEFETGGGLSFELGHYLNKDPIDENLEVISNIIQNQLEDCL